MTKAFTITLAVGVIVTVLLFLYVYNNGGKAKYCATPTGPCLEATKV